LHNEHKHPFSTANWRALFQTKAGREILNEHLSWKNVEETQIFMPEFVRLLRWLWPLLRPSSALGKKIDISIGIMITTLILHRIFIREAPRTYSLVQMADRTWKNDRA
jgi:hypothetical protein